MEDPYRYFDGAKFKEDDRYHFGHIATYHWWLCQQHWQTSQKLWDMSGHNRCTKCGQLLDGEYAEVGNEVFCHACADAEIALPG